MHLWMNWLFWYFQKKTRVDFYSEKYFSSRKQSKIKNFSRCHSVWRVKYFWTLFKKRPGLASNLLLKSLDYRKKFISHFSILLKNDTTIHLLLMTKNVQLFENSENFPLLLLSTNKSYFSVELMMLPLKCVAFISA